MALSYYDQSRFSESEHCILKAIKLEPNNSMFYFIYAMLSAFQGKYHSAELLYKKAIELDPHFYNAYAELGWLYKNKMHFCRRQKIFLTNSLSEEFSLSKSICCIYRSRN